MLKGVLYILERQARRPSSSLYGAGLVSVPKYRTLGTVLFLEGPLPVRRFCLYFVVWPADRNNGRGCPFSPQQVDYIEKDSVPALIDTPVMSELLIRYGRPPL